MSKVHNKILSGFFTPLFYIFVAIVIAACSQKDEGSGGGDRHLSNSKNYLQQGQYRAAILEARNSLAKSPSAEGAVHLAQLYLDLGQPRSAITLLEQVENKNDKILLKLSDAFINAQKFSSARKTLDTVSDTAKESVDYQLYSGLTASGLGDIATAEQYLDKALSLEPSNEKALMSKLIIALMKRDESTAQTNIDTLKTEYSNSPESLLLLAKIEFQRSNFQAAEELLMNAIHNAKETDVMLPVKSSVLQLLVETLTQQGRFADAVPFNKLLSESNPGMQESKEALTTIVQQVQLGNWDEAETLLEDFKKNYPGSNAAQSLLGLVRLQQGKFEDADAILENAVDPETASPILVGASVLSKLKNNEKLEAFAILKEALTTKPDNTKLLAMYGALALELGDNAVEGEKSLLKVIELDPSNASVYGLLANHYFKVGKPEEAKKIMLQAYEYNPQIPDLQYAIIRSFVKEGFVDDAKTFAQRLKNEAPKQASTWVSSALLSLQNKQYQAAETELSKALKIDDEAYAAWALLAATQLKLEKRDAALATMENALVKYPDNRTLLIQTAQLYLAQKNNDKAEEKAKELLRIGEPALANFIRADVLNNQGKTQEAYQLLLSEWDTRPNHRLAIAVMRYSSQVKETLPSNFIATWEKVAPENPQAMLAIGNIYLGEGKTDKALNYFEKVLTLDENNVIALNNAAWFQQESGNSARALELADKAALLAPESAAVLDTAGWIKYKNADRSSLELLKKAAELAPDSKEIQDHYAEAKANLK